MHEHVGKKEFGNVGLLSERKPGILVRETQGVRQEPINKLHQAGFNLMFNTMLGGECSHH